MENDLINRAALGIGKCNPDVFEDKGYAKGWNAAIELIEAAPAVDAVEVRHGRWMYTEHGFPTEPCVACSNCGYDMDFDICTRIKSESFSYHPLRSKYCPNCGARMDGEEEHNAAD